MMRHGKSRWDGQWSEDHERPLAPRGQRDADRIGRILSAAGYRPDLVLASTAERAAATAGRAAKTGQWPCPVTLDEGLYGTGPDTVLDSIRGLPAEVRTALLVGHNPTWAETTALLIGGGHLRFPTAAVACLEFTGPWTTLRSGRAELRWFLIPRMLQTLSETREPEGPD